MNPLDEVCASVRDLFQARSCVCAVVTGEHLEFVAGDGSGAGRLLGVRLRIGEGIAGYVAQSGMPVELLDVRTDERWAQGLAVHDEYVPGAMLAMPLVADDGRVVGVLNVLDPAPEVTAGATQQVGGVLPALAVVAGAVVPLLADWSAALA